MNNNMNNNQTPENNQTNCSFEDQIKNTVDSILDNGTVNKVIEDCMRESIQKAINRSFEYGKLGDTLGKRIESVLIPYIETCDISKLNIKLDTILTDIVNNTTLADNRKILENFRGLMKEIPEKTISLDDIFEAYCNDMAKNVDTAGMDVTTDGGEPEYEPFMCSYRVEDISRDSSIYETKLVTLSSEEDRNDIASSEITFELRRYKGNKIENEYSLGYHECADINSLKYLSDTEVLLLRLTRSHTKITIPDTTDCEEYITPETEPEPTWV